MSYDWGVSALPWAYASFVPAFRMTARGPTACPILSMTGFKPIEGITLVNARLICIPILHIGKLRLGGVK